MAYKDILVHLDPTSDTEHRLRLAASMAGSHGARLIGVDACSDAAFEGDWRDRAFGLKDLFEEAIKQSGVRDVYFSADRWRKGGGEHHYAHYADLIDASQQEFEARDLIISGIPEGVLAATE